MNGYTPCFFSINHECDPFSLSPPFHQADRSIESLFAELVSNGILQQCPHVHVRDYLGSSSFMAATLEKANIIPDPSMAQVGGRAEGGGRGRGGLRGGEGTLAGNGTGLSGSIDWSAVSMSPTMHTALPDPTM